MAEPKSPDELVDVVEVEPDDAGCGDDTASDLVGPLDEPAHDDVDVPDASP